MPISRPSTSGRTRSKTSDNSDLLRGGRAEQQPSSSHLTPQSSSHPESDSSTGRSKSKISTFFVRKRKSSSVSPASAKSAETRARQDADVPPLPSLDMSRLSMSKSNASRSTPNSPSQNSQLPSSLPPVNVSPPSFSPFSQLLGHRDRARDRSSRGSTDQTLQQFQHERQQPTKGGSSIPIPVLRHLRPQKSTSFEFVCRSTDSQVSNKQAQARPIITVSAPPPPAEEDAATYQAPRAPPSPPVSPTVQVHFRTGKHDGSGSASEPQSPQSEASSPTSRMHFPLPPPHVPRESFLRRERAESGTDDIVSTRTSISASSTASSARDALAYSARSRAQKHASAVPVGPMRPKPERATTYDHSHSAPESQSLPGRRLSQNKGTSPPPASRLPTASSSPTQSSFVGRKVPAPLLMGVRRSPRAQPPTEPLPSPPLSSGSEAEQKSSILTIAASMSVGQVHTPVFRQRAGTASSLSSTATSTIGKDAGSISEGPPTPIRERFAQDHDAPRSPTSPTRDGADKLLHHDAATVEQLRDALNAQAAKYKRLSSYLLTLTERHSMEKTELMRRIETLEKEARKREREVTGLRWLVMNAGQRSSTVSTSTSTNGSAAESPRANGSSSAARVRLSSKASSSQGSHAHSTKTASPDPQRGMSMDSNSESIEEGLFELQKSVSDFIAPLAPSPPTAAAIASPAPPRASSNGSSPQGRMRRSNTMPDGLTQLPVVVAALKQKQARRTSSPMIPATTSASSSTPSGLGFDEADLPSIPSLPDSDLGHESGSSLPSLTATNTTSSGLSAIPETPVKAGTSSERAKTTRERTHSEKKDREERRVLRALHRLSGSSSASSASASTAYSSNLKLGSSPSIGQVLDHASEKERDMDSILRKLRTHGHEH